MDGEAALIRSEMSRTRAALDRKLSRLESRARELTPRRAAERLVHQRVFEQVMGGVLIAAGSLLAWRRRPRR